VLRLIFAAGCTTGDTIGCLNFTSLFHVYVMYCMNCFFIGNAVRAAFLCKHVRLSRVAYNKLTYSLTTGWMKRFEYSYNKEINTV